VRFGGTFLLMFLCTRRRSNFMRWVIAIPFNLTILATTPYGCPRCWKGIP